MAREVPQTAGVAGWTSRAATAGAAAAALAASGTRIEPLLPKVERRFRYPGRKRLPDRQALQGILFVLHTGIAWRHLPLELGFGGGSTCYRRLDEWQRAGVWERLRPSSPIVVVGSENHSSNIRRLCPTFSFGGRPKVHRMYRLRSWAI